MKYKNIMNGAVIDVTVPISGENWIRLGEQSETVIKKEPKETTPKKVVEEPKEFDLTKMTVKELKAYAKSNDIELPSEATKKDEIIEAIAMSFQD